jgi:GrpB-like predicted nucleotidyltransferase (UPF0157 family)
MITIVPYQATWNAEFMRLGRHLRHRLDSLALRIDHIGSTAVPGLAAKNIIDIQLTVAELTSHLEYVLRLAGYYRVRQITQDRHADGAPAWLFRPSPAQRPVNVHVRLSGRGHQRYAVLFRDYLRACPDIAQAYAQVKLALVRNPYRSSWNDLEGYYEVKNPVFDIVIAGAEVWATSVGWEMGPTDC